MTRNQNLIDVSRSGSPPAHTPRLRLKAKAPRSGYVDGAWWPHSLDLPIELPDLLAVLSVRLGPIDRVLYKLGEWSTAPAKLAIGARAVRLDGYRYQPPNSVEILGFNRGRITLLVVPPGTDPDDAHTMMMAAAAADDSSTVNGLLNHLWDSAVQPQSTKQSQSTKQPQSTKTEQEDWQSEGGSPQGSALTAMSGRSTRS